MHGRRYNQFPNKRRKNMSEPKGPDSSNPVAPSCGNAFLLAEEQFDSATQKEWTQVQNSRKERRNKPNLFNKQSRDSVPYRDGQRSNRNFDHQQSYRGNKRPSENRTSHNKRFPGEENKFHDDKRGNRNEKNMDQTKSNEGDGPGCNNKPHTSSNAKKTQEYHQCLNYNKLQEISAKDSTDIIRILANSRSGFDELLNENIKPDWMYLIIKILSKLTQSDWEENKDYVLNRAATPEFFKKIREFVLSIVTDDQILESHKRREGLEHFFECLLDFYQAVINKLPSFAAEHLSAPLKATKIAMENVCEHQSVSINNKLLERIKQLISNFEERKKEKEDREKVLKEEKDVFYPKPLGDIKYIPLFPRPEDIDNTQGSVVPNKIKGPYNSVQHYLDIHFRLLREDFISPLRQGINDFRIGKSSNNHKAKKKINNIRIYPRVTFLKTKVISDRVGYDICFDPDKKLRVKWEYSKRFIYGSLLLFTTDNFHSFFLATVIKRDLKTVEKERVISIQLCESTHEKSHDILSREFLMAESEVYFEPYYNVLKALRGFNSSTFPMKKYIVCVETKIGRPAHTRNGSDTYSVSVGEKGRKTIKLFDNRYWPSCSDLGFDESQLIAFKTALINELAVIQGPPGTGKTYLGLKIAEALLQNSAMWNMDGLSPILVICFTNHALDQFLEGILQKGLTNNLIRIGGRSQSEILEPFNLRERRRSIVNYSPNVSQALLMKDIKKNMTEIFENIKIIQDNLDNLEKNDGILSLKSMKIVINTYHHSFFRNDEDLLQWLLVGLSHKIKSDKKLLYSAGTDRQKTKFVVEEFEIDLADYENATRLKEVLFDKIDLEDLEDSCNENVTGNIELRNYYSLTIHDIEKRIEQCVTLLDSLLDSDINEKNTQTKIKDTKQVETDLKDILIYFKENLIKYEVPLSNEEIDRLHGAKDLNILNMSERWRLYKIWVSYMKNGNRLLMGQLEEKFRMGSRRYDEGRQFDDLRIVQQADVVGITTTTAARLQGMLRELKPKIVIVEEAAEVLEAHIVASLSVYCQHLILIGDHKQLRPSPSEYKLAKDYQLDVSLFERLINNGVGYCTLSTQHRMRPEISRLLVPTIYPTLTDHPSTLYRERIRGIDKNVFFMTHPHHEEDAEDIKSKKNLFEARLVMCLARHLLLQGYRPDQITVLTTYNGQMYLMKEEQKRLEISKDLQVTVVDNYQGEENKIILLSLVRSNNDKKIGFLKTENRVCVALSRAQDGLYVFGNMDCLTADSVLWQRIKQSFIDQNAYGPALLLRCETHQNEITRVLNHTDFSAVMEGGCSKPCGELLPCGHHCKSLCHVSKDRHLRYTCSEPCNRLCNENHLCSKKCYQECGRCELPMVRTLDCGHQITFPCCVEYKNKQCDHKVTLHFPDCNHRVEVECYRKDHKQCPEPCLGRLECGHSCSRTCHVLDDPDHIDYICPKPCSERPVDCTTEGHKCPLACFEKCQPCEIEVVKQLQCGHTVTTICTNKAFLCNAECNRKLDCGHRCKRKCCEECGGCKVKVTKTVQKCGHTVKIACSQEARTEICLGECSVMLSCGHKCARLCKEQCSPDFCEERVRLPVALPCNHTGARLPCNIVARVNLINKNDKEQLVQYCEEPCLKELNCKHVCSGTCGQCMQGRIHKVCEEDCGNILICGHSCPVPCRLVCPPCDRKCQMKCIHSKCTKKCGEPCVPCKEPCEIRCLHTRCTKKCGELCSRQPCTKPCLLPLEPCNHPCVGYCGEPCPPCKQCQPDQYEMFFYTDEEEEEDAKWVLLNDCRHVFESRNLEQWLGMDQEGSEIKLKKCPRCSTPVGTTTRYMNVVKKTFLDIQAVKEKVFGHIKEIRKAREDLLQEINKISPKEMEGYSKEEVKGKNELKALRNLLKDELSYISRQHRRNELSDHKASLYIYMSNVYLSIQKRIVDDWDKLTVSCKNKAFRHVNFLISVLNQRKEKISGEEIDSFNLEFERLHRCFDVFMLESNENFLHLKTLDHKTQTQVLHLHDQLKTCVYSFNVFKTDINEKVKKIIKEVALLLQTVVSDEERIMIHKAMSTSWEHYGGMRSIGRWYKCAGCGDLYCVADCGQVNQIARCGRCKTTIGDRSRVSDSEMARALGNM